MQRNVFQYLKKRRKSIKKIPTFRERVNLL